MLALSPFVQRKLALAFYRFDQSKDGLVKEDDFVQYGEKVAALLTVPKDSETYKKVCAAYMSFWNDYFEPSASDGVVTLQAYIEATTRFAGMPQSEAMAKKGNAVIFDSIDLDGSGQISRAELVLFLQPMGVSEQDANVAFGHMDRDGDGHISREEFAQNLTDYYLSDDRESPGNWFYGPI